MRNTSGKIDIGRSLPLSSFAPIAAIPGVRLISLQKRHGLEQLAELPSGMAVETLGEDFGKMGVHARLLDGFEPGAVEVRLFDNRG